MGTEWRPGEAMSKSEQQLPLNSRSSDASRSDGGSSAAKPGVMSGGGNAPTDNGAIKKKRVPKFLTKQFEMITKASTGTSPRRNHNLLGKEYVIVVPGSRAVASTNSVDPDPNLDDRNPNAIADQQHNVAKPPIEFVTAPIDYKTERRGVVRGEPPLDFITERSPRISPRVAALSTRVHASVSRSRSSSGRSPSGSARLSYSAGTPRSERSVLSIPETVISSAEQRYSLKSASRTTSPSSLGEWSSHSLDRHGELSIAGLSLGEGRNISHRTDVTSAQSPARSEAQALDYGPDDTDSGVEMYHETTSASPGSYSRRSSCSLAEDGMPEFEDSDGVSHHDYRRSEHHRGDHSRSPSYSSHSSSSQSGSARYSPSSSTRNKGQYSPNTLRKLVSKQLLDSPSSKMRHHGDYYDHRRNVDSSMAKSSNFSSRRHGSQKRRDNGHSASASSKVVVLLGKYGPRRRGTTHGRIDINDTPVALDSMTPEESVAVFHDEVARMMLEEGQECGEAHDVEEFLDGYLRLRSPFYVAMVDEFFRAMCVDCYKRPVEIPVEGRSGSFSTSFKSLRSDSQLHHFHNSNMRI